MRKNICSVLGAFLITINACHAGGIEELQRFVDKSISGKASFIQRVFGSEGELVQESTGVLSFKRPGQFKWHYQEPYEQILVGDGVYLWVYDIDLMQVTRIPVEDAVGSNPAAILYGSKDIDLIFGLDALESVNNMQRVRITPYEESRLFKSIELGFSEANLARMTLYDHFGQKTTIDFFEFEIPKLFEKDEFKFSPPENVDVVTP